MNTLKPRSSHHCAQPVSLRGNRGFSLIEVLVAVLVLAIGLLGMAAMQGLAVQSNHSAYMRTQATYLAYEIVDAMRANRTQAQAGAYNINFNATVSSSLTGVAAIDLAAWRDRVNDLLPAGESEITQNGDIFTISVRWLDSRDGSVLPPFTLRTQI